MGGSSETEQAIGPFRVKWLREEVPLRSIAGEHFDLLDLHAGFDAFGRHDHARRMGKRRNRTDDRRILRIFAETVDKFSIDLEHINRISPEIPETRIDAAEIVNRELNTKFAELTERYAIAVELSNFRGIIANINCGDTQASIDHIVLALVELSMSDGIVSPGTARQSRSSGAAVSVTTQVLSPRDA
jgi:hypothetical protein